MHVANWLNSWGAELRSVARIGSRRGLSSEFYQPLGVASPWFGSAQIGYEAGSDDVFNQGQRALRQASSLSNATGPGPPARQLWRCAHRRGRPARQRAEVLIPAPVDGARPRAATASASSSCTRTRSTRWPSPARATG